MRGHGFLTIWFCLWSNIPHFVFELSYIFYTFENMKFPTFSWLFDPFHNPPWLCQTILYLFKTVIFLKSDSLIFQDFPYLWTLMTMYLLPTDILWLKLSNCNVQTVSKDDKIQLYLRYMLECICTQIAHKISFILHKMSGHHIESDWHTSLVFACHIMKNCADFYTLCIILRWHMSPIAQYLVTYVTLSRQWYDVTWRYVLSDHFHHYY